MLRVVLCLKLFVKVFDASFQGLVFFCITIAAEFCSTEFLYYPMFKFSFLYLTLTQ